MSSRSGGPARGPVAIALCLMACCVATAVVCAATARAADYKMLLCAGNNGSNSFQTATNTAYSKSPSGIFEFQNYCGPAPDPAGNSAFLRIRENAVDGTAADTAYGSISWTVPPWIAILAGGGYTREPSGLNDGWRARFWAEGFDGSTNDILMQGAGVPNGSLGGIGWGMTSVFAPHVWPFTSFGYYRRFVFETTCFRPAGCDRSGENTVDANTISLVLADVSPVELQLTNTSAPLLSGKWVRGNQTATYAWSDQGSGIRMEWIDIDGARRFTIDHAGECDTGASGPNGEFARVFQPCATGSGIGRSYGFDTAALPDGAHTLQACGQDYAQWQGLYGTGGASCRSATIRTDNTSPGKPASLAIRSANPHRYLDRFGATFSLPPNQGSPIAKVHYEVLNAANEVVVPEKTASGTNPTEVADIEGPPHAGAYRLKLWLEDEVGFQGPAAEVEIPRDTTPPAAPQDLRVSGPSTARWNAKLDLAWHDITDDGSPIDTVHYEILDGAGDVLGAPRAVTSEGVEALHGIEAPAQRGAYEARVWLEDEEGNTGAPAAVALPLDTTPPAAPQGLSVTPPPVSRAAQGFDVRWHDITDDGSPINAAHYQVLDGEGKVVVSTRTVKGEGIEAIEDLEAPRSSGAYTLRLWLEDEEGNAGAPVSAPLAYDCLASDVAGASSLTAGLGSGGVHEAVVRQGKGSTLAGRLTGPGGGVEGAPVCVFSRVLTEAKREFLGIAVSGQGGAWRFAVPPGASRELDASYRFGHREVQARALLQTVVHPTFKVTKKVVYNKHRAKFTGRLPGPDNNEVLVVAQVKRGEGWLAFHRYRTRSNGEVTLSYKFNKTLEPTEYEIRLQVRSQSGYPYEEGDSDPLRLIVLPKEPASRPRG